MSIVDVVRAFDLANPMSLPERESFNLFINLETRVRRLASDLYLAKKIARVRSVVGELVGESEKESKLMGQAWRHCRFYLRKRSRLGCASSPHPTKSRLVSGLEQASPIDPTRSSTTIAPNSNRRSFRRPCCQIDIAYPTCVDGLPDAEVMTPPNSPEEPRLTSLVRRGIRIDQETVRHQSLVR